MNWLSERLRVNPEVGVQRVQGRLLAAGPGDVLHSFEDDRGEVSAVGERIVELSDGSRTIEEVVAALCDEFDVPREICLQDTEKFIRLLMVREVLIPA